MHEPLLTRPRTILGGTQRIYRFPNGYGASVIEGGVGTYGQELAVLRFAGEGADDWNLTYDTPVTDDVLGYLDDEALAAALDQIAALPSPSAVSR